MNTPNTAPFAALSERLGAIVRSIASGNNACGTLFDRQTGSLNTDFIAEAARPTLEVYEDELAELRQQRDELLRDIETKRAALESAVANIPGLAAMRGTGDAFRAALPGHHFLNN